MSAIKLNATKPEGDDDEIEIIDGEKKLSPELTIEAEVLDSQELNVISFSGTSSNSGSDNQSSTN